MVPKIIHYCWFGSNLLPELTKKCIDSWKRYCPDYEIIEWNETNFDFSDCQYACDAYDAKKYAFVSDYARFKILYENGGVYFDTDVELINSIDNIICGGDFLCCEQFRGNYSIATGLGLGFEKNNKICEEILLSYSKSEFDKINVNNNETVVIRVTNIMKKYGFNSESSNIQSVSNITIYPPEYFCPMCFETGEIHLTNNTVSIHHFDASWLTDEEKYIKKTRYILSTKLPIKIAHWLSLIIGFVKYHGILKLPKAMIDFEIRNMKKRNNRK